MGNNCPKKHLFLTPHPPPKKLQSSSDGSLPTPEDTSRQDSIDDNDTSNEHNDYDR